MSVAGEVGDELEVELTVAAGVELGLVQGGADDEAPVLARSHQMDGQREVRHGVRRRDRVPIVRVASRDAKFDGVWAAEQVCVPLRGPRLGHLIVRVVFVISDDHAEETVSVLENLCDHDRRVCVQCPRPASAAGGRSRLDDDRVLEDHLSPFVCR